MTSLLMIRGGIIMQYIISGAIKSNSIRVKECAIENPENYFNSILHVFAFFEKFNFF